MTGKRQQVGVFYCCLSSMTDADVTSYPAPPLLWCPSASVADDSHSLCVVSCVCEADFPGSGSSAIAQEFYLTQNASLMFGFKVQVFHLVVFLSTEDPEVLFKKILISCIIKEYIQMTKQICVKAESATFSASSLIYQCLFCTNKYLSCITACISPQ